MKTIRMSFACISLLILNISISAQVKQEAEKKYTIDNCINTFTKDKIEKTDAGYQYWFVNRDFLDGRTIKLSVVGPHKATHAPHVHSEDEFFFILEGKAELYLEGKWKEVEANTSFYCPSNIEHGIRNPGEKELKYLVIKKYETKGAK